MLRQLIEDICAYRGDHELSLIIADDGSKARYLGTIRDEYPFLKINARQFKKNGGKQGYWKIVNWLFSELKARKFDYVLMLPDDVRLKPNLFDDLVRGWEAIYDEQKACLSPLLTENHWGKKMWGSRVPVQMRTTGPKILRTQWMDLCFFAPRNFFELLDFEVHPISPRRWKKDSLKSSGVGQQLTTRLISTGANLYHLSNSLVLHGDHASKMNFEERLRSPMISKE